MLPKHVAAEMISDLSAEQENRPFRKMYMNRYENVRSVKTHQLVKVANTRDKIVATLKDYSLLN